MRVLVTGGAGFIGSHLVQALIKQGHAVVVVDNLSSGKRERLPKEAMFVEGDIREMSNLNLPPTVDAVFHLAAQIDVRESVANPMHDASVNVQGTIAVLDYAVKAKAKKFIFSSSGGAIYGPCEQIPTPETSHCLSSSPYGISKWSAEHYVRLYRRLHGLQSVILRYSNVYGPGQDGSKESGVIAIFTERARQGLPLVIFGDGEQTRDFVYVQDVVAANLKAFSHDRGGIFNISTGQEITINALADTLNRLLPRPVEVSHAQRRAGEERRSCLDASRAQRDLGWQPTVALEAGLAITLSSKPA